VPPNKGDEVIVCVLKQGKDLVVSSIETTLVRTSDHVREEIGHAIANNRIFDDLPRDEKEQMYLEELREYQDTKEDILTGVKQVAAAIRKAKHVIVYTGAGVSTSAKIPDYRGPEGAWTVRDYGTQSTGKKKQLDEAEPTYTHYAITELARKGIIKFVISTNLDGLHIRSGIPIHLISEMHGNCYKEICYDCGKEYLRSFNVLITRTDRWTHLTYRNCTACGGALRDTIAHFTENINAKEYESSVINARNSDLALILGTSMFVQPAASLPYKTLENNGQVFLVNLQCTPIDHFVTKKIYTETDEFMQLLMKELEIENFNQSYDHLNTLLAEEKAVENKKKTRSILSKVGVSCAVLAVAFLVWKLL